ncbi:MAG: response regulator [Myxococcota bacterium]|jgi:PAS domain S-box-containing protein|nr:response regulator [Myxococcota bacterium]
MDEKSQKLEANVVNGQADNATSKCFATWLTTCAPMLETLPIPVCLMGLDGKLRWSNSALAELLGLENGSASGWSLCDHACSEDEKAACTRRCTKILSMEPAPATFRCSLTRADGRIVHTQTAWRYQRNQAQEIAGIVCVLSDITQNVLAQRAHKLESLGVLAGGVAHDFNNLLVGILGNAELAMMELLPESPARNHMRNIVTAAKRASDLVSQMLAYSGKGRFVIERIDLSAMVEEMLPLLQVSVSPNVVLRLDVASSIPAVEGDAAQIRQVVINLVTNASESMGDRSGVVHLSTGVMVCDRDYLKQTYLDDDLEEGNYCFFEVSDNGAGMPEETRSRIFDPFFTTKFTGRGLGLPAVLGIVRGHRGAIKVTTEPGKGTTFKVLLPAADEPAHKGKPLRETTEPPYAGNVHVLVVDDEPTVRSVACAMLEKLGCTVECASDGQEALELFEKAPESFDCVLLDLTMPRLDGEQTFLELRRIHKDVRVLLSSGYNEQSLMGRFAGKGLAGFIQKPYRLELLARKLKETIG